ncbi:SIR2 family protein [Ralstonia soli]|uniref:SIR2 family protein n=1 Tax=Ralstonia soli TaxID=2953896 RepID=A0ABT1ALI7_9RALS|nr:SIR2 family protein [Ralstonia soli]MCO5399191.1 SIR2 family protein [Ralstonia soli]
MRKPPRKAPLIRWPRRLVEDIARRRAVLFFGSGVSANARSADGKSRPPTWAELLNAAAADMEAKAPQVANEVRTFVERGDVLTAAEIVRRVLGPRKLTALLRRNLVTPQFRAAPIHDALIALDFRITLTPNFDSLYETRAMALNPSAVVCHYSDRSVATRLRDEPDLIIKTHGSMSEPASLIFSRCDYIHARSRYRAFYGLVEALLRTYTFLFVGCGIDDSDMRALLEAYGADHPGAERHYFVAAADTFSDLTASVLADALNLHVLRYDAPAADHAALVDAFKMLRAQVDAERAAMRNPSTTA